MLCVASAAGHGSHEPVDQLRSNLQPYMPLIVTADDPLLEAAKVRAACVGCDAPMNVATQNSGIGRTQKQKSARMRT